MWADYNYSNFPIVNVNLEGQLKRNSDYYDFIRKWTLLYQKKNKFKFIFNTTNCGYVNMKYSLKLPSFIKKLKRLPTQYLTESIIIYNSSWIKFLLKLSFNIQSPVAPVYLIHKNDYDTISGDVFKGIKDKKLSNKITLYNPNLD